VPAFISAWIKDTKGSGVRFNVVNPGVIDTPSLRKALDADADAHDDDDDDDSKIKALDAQSPVGRIGQPDEIGRVVAFLASDAASFVHGVELFADGGSRFEFLQGRSNVSLCPAGRCGTAGSARGYRSRQVAGLPGRRGCAGNPTGLCDRSRELQGLVRPA
jgi:hypothetical protein